VRTPAGTLLSPLVRLPGIALVVAVLSTALLAAATSSPTRLPVECCHAPSCPRPPLRHGGGAVRDPVYLAVSGVMWCWHQLFGFLLGPASGAAWALSVVFLVLTLPALLQVPVFVAAAEVRRGSSGRRSRRPRW
jgi:hypothetical protein